MNRFKIFFTTSLGFAVLFFGSCKHDDRLAAYPVAGKVIYRGKPAEGAVVAFNPMDGGGVKTPCPGGQANNRGEFRLSTYLSYDGAPAGRYAVTIVYPSPEKQENGENVGPDLLKGRYGDPKTTPLRVEVKKENNNLEPFQIK